MDRERSCFRFGTIEVGGRVGLNVRVTVQFNDEERIEGASEAVTLTRIGFPVVPDAGNNQLVWVSLTAMKYVLLHSGNRQAGYDADPREAQDLPKVVVRFHDGEVIRTYRDESWGEAGEGFKFRVWDADLLQLIPTLVSLHAVKGIFFVKEWDSRTAEEKILRYPAADGRRDAAGSSVLRSRRW